MGKTIIYISYWKLSEPLTAATIYPHVKVLADMPGAARVIVTYPADGPGELPEPIHSKVDFLPVVVHSDKAVAFIQFIRAVKRQVSKYHPQKIIAKGAMAGAVAWSVSRKNQIPFYVESFEPHADYMAESGIWSRFGIKYQVQKFLENMQMKHAEGLLTVSNNFRKIIEENSDAPVVVLPCTADEKTFEFNPERRASMRAQLDITDQVTGIYVGKFGGLYLDKEAFKVFREAFDEFPSFKLIILSTQSSEGIREKAVAAGIPHHSMIIHKAGHTEVASFLSAADFSFATITPGEFKKYNSLVKTSEYLINGLPILMTKGVGDSVENIEQLNLGAYFEPGKDHHPAFGKMKQILAEPGHRQRIAEQGKRLRGSGLIAQVFGRMFKDLARS